MPAADRFQVYLDEDSQSWLLGRAAAMMQGDSVPGKPHSNSTSGVSISPPS